MAFRVRCFGYPGTAQIPVVLPRQDKADAVQVLMEPYLWKSGADSNAAAVISIGPISPDGAKILRVEVPDGNKIRFEICPPGRTQTVPDQDSPLLTGSDQFMWGDGWIFKFVDAASFAP